MKTERKLMVIGLVCLLVSIAFGSAFAVTRTITSTGDSFDTFIRNSKGNYWTATAANLQSAIADLGNLTGWVDGGNNNISISASIKLGTKCELRNVKLYLTTAANKTMITNYNTAGNDGIYIHDVNLNGNGLNQPEWWSNTNQIHYFAHGMYFNKTTNMTIKNVVIKNTQCGGIILQKTKNVQIDMVKCFDIGSLFKYSGSAETQWYAAGIFLYNASGCTISNVIVNDSYTAGIIIESNLATPAQYHDHNVVVSNCFVSNSSYGYYLEDASDVLFSNCMAERCDDTKIYGSAAGFIISTYCERISLVGCEVSGSQRGFVSTGIHCMYTNCISKGSSSHGFVTYGHFASYYGCQSYNDVGNGFRISAFNATLIGCIVNYSGAAGIVNNPNDNSYVNAKNGYTHISGCSLYMTQNYGLDIYASNASVHDCTLTRCAYGISFSTSGSSQNITCTNNRVENTDVNTPIILKNVKRGMVSNNYVNWCDAQNSIGINLTSCKNITVMGNTIQGHGGYYPRYGVREFTRGDHNWIIFNKGIDITTLTTIVGTTSKVNCSTNADTVWDNWNFDV